MLSVTRQNLPHPLLKGYITLFEVSSFLYLCTQNQQIIMDEKIDKHIKHLFSEKIKEIEQALESDVLVYYGPIDDGIVYHLNNLIIDLNPEKKDEKKLSVLLTTGGGSATACERFVGIFRHFYSEVNFLIPDYAFSAGTILTMSGDNIFMDYLSVLGPIDPQVRTKDGHYVAALGYLDKINDLLQRAKDNSLSNAEFLILKDFDLADLRSYEQAKELTIDLLNRWLVKYKFKNWGKDRTTRENRAKEIADKLSDNNIWKSHGRPIHKERLEDLGLKISDLSSLGCYSKIKELYHLLREYVQIGSLKVCIQTRQKILS